MGLISCKLETPLKKKLPEEFHIMLINKPNTFKAMLIKSKRVEDHYINYKADHINSKTKNLQTKQI